MKKLLITLFSMFALVCSAQIEVTCPDCGHPIIVNVTANGVTVESVSHKQVQGFADLTNEEKTQTTGSVGQCKATTKAGTRCSRKAEDASGYCWQHKKSATSSSVKTSTGTKSSFSSSGSSSSGGRCKAKTKSGTQCSRAARSNGYCWQHGG